MSSNPQSVINTASYVDINSLYGINSTPELGVESAAIANSLYNLLNCPRGSRFFLPEYGTDIFRYLHEPCDAATAKNILLDFIYSINSWEPRITLDLSNCSVVPMPTNDGFIVTIPYTIKRLNRSNTSKFRLNSIGTR